MNCALSSNHRPRPEPPSLLVIGMGAVGATLLPLMRRQWPNAPITVVERTIDAPKRLAARRWRLDLHRCNITRDNHVQILAPLLKPGGLLVNLGFETSSLDLMALAQRCDAGYLDTCIDDWPREGLAEGVRPHGARLRQAVLARNGHQPQARTALVAHGANPGFVSTLTLRALELMRATFLEDMQAPASCRADWAALSRRLGIRVIQIAEIDSQTSLREHQPREFVNTWSVDGLIAECLQPAEYVPGSHEWDGAQGTGLLSAALARPGYRTPVRSWSLGAGAFEGWLLSHNEAFSIGNYLRLNDGRQGGYNPTVFFAYRPCPLAVQSMRALAVHGRSHAVIPRILQGHETTGTDELGVLLISERFPTLWLGSSLSCAQAHAMVSGATATTLQVASSVMAGIAWVLEHPHRGVVESEGLDHDLLYRATHASWEPIGWAFTDWPHGPGLKRLRTVDFVIEPSSSLGDA